MSSHFIIIGAKRSGTTSLYNYLTAHPQINGARGHGRREVHFFDYKHLYRQGIDWYHSQFKPNTVTGETSPTMLQHWLAPERLSYHLPDCKLIVLLRNPVDRAYSDYWLARRKEHTHDGFENALQMEAGLLRVELEKPRFWEDCFYLSHHHLCGFLERGYYARQLKRWLEYFPREQFLIHRSEDFFICPADVVQDAWRWLGLDNAPMPKFKQWQQAEYPPMSRQQRKQLEQHYAKANAELRKLIGWAW